LLVSSSPITPLTPFMRTINVKTRRIITIPMRISMTTFNQAN
jgi:hypothetical protein